MICTQLLANQKNGHRVGIWLVQAEPAFTASSMRATVPRQNVT